MASPFKIGLTAGALTALDGLSTPVPDPQWEFSQYRTKEKLASGNLKGRGARTILWSFPMIEINEIAQLETFNIDEPIFIQSRKRDRSLAVFEVLPNWVDPREDGDHISGMPDYRNGLVIEFVIIQEMP